MSYLPSFLSQLRQKWMNGERIDLTTKEIETMSHLGQKPPMSFYHKNPLTMLMYFLVYQKPERNQTKTTEVTSASQGVGVKL